MKLGRWMSALLGLAVAITLLGGAFAPAAAKIKIIAPPARVVSASVYQDAAGSLSLADVTIERSATGEISYSAEDILVDPATGIAYTLVGWVVDNAEGRAEMIDLRGTLIDVDPAQIPWNPTRGRGVGTR